MHTLQLRPVLIYHPPLVVVTQHIPLSVSNSNPLLNVCAVFECLLISSDSKPTLAKLSSLKASKIQVIKRVAPRWYDLGSLLDFDDSGTELDIIKEKHRSDPVNCSRAMFQHWVKGNGRGPHTWRTLIELLEESDHKVLAGEIRNALAK